MEEKYCQSCGMPMGIHDELYGTEVNGSKSQDYCKYCYENGHFTADCTMEQMIEFCIPHTPNMTPDEARNMMHQWFPTLKRWTVPNK